MLAMKVSNSITHTQRCHGSTRLTMTPTNTPEIVCNTVSNFKTKNNPNQLNINKNVSKKVSK